MLEDSRYLKLNPLRKNIGSFTNAERFRPLSDLWGILRFDTLSNIPTRSPSYSRGVKGFNSLIDFASLLLELAEIASCWRQYGIADT